MNKDIENYEKEKLRKENPDENEKLIIKKKKQKKVWLYVVIPLCLLNSILKGPPILYLIIGFGIPWMIKQSNK